MAVIAHVLLRGVDQEQYDTVRAKTGWLEHAPEGGLAHLTWWEGPDCHNVDAWEDEEAFTRFGQQRLAAGMAAAGADVEPEVTFHPAHEVFVPRQVLVAPTAGAQGTDPVAVIRGGYEAFARGDVPAVLELFDPQIAWYSPDSTPFGGSCTGPEEVGRFFARLPEHFAELRVEPREFLAQGSTVVVLGRSVGRSRSGNAFEVPWVHVWTFSDGRVTGFTEHIDTAKVNAALGAAAP